MVEYFFIQGSITLSGPRIIHYNLTIDIEDVKFIQLYDIPWNDEGIIITRNSNKIDVSEGITTYYVKNLTLYKVKNEMVEKIFTNIDLFDSFDKIETAAEILLL